MRRVTIDNDHYILDFPISDQWEKAFRFIPTEDQKRDYANTIVWRPAGQDSDDMYLYVAIRKRKDLVYCGTYEHIPGNFRPALRMEFTLPTGWKNGKLITGGSLYVNGAPIAVPRKPQDVLKFDKDTIQSIAIGDTCDDPAAQLSWIFVDDTLICTKTLIKQVSPKDLYEVLEGSEIIYGEKPS